MSLNIPKNIIVIIPARGGSKRIKNKNLAVVGGRPLLAHSIIAAKQSKHVTRVIVSTEDEAIAKTAKEFGAEVITRPAQLASDDASSESALIDVLDQLEAAERYIPELVVFLQCTSPARRIGDIDRAIEQLVSSGADSLFSACRNHGLIWQDNHGKIDSLSYNYHKRKREQQMEVQYRENGSIYVFSPRLLRDTSNRLGGKIAVYEMDFLSSFQVDNPDDIKLVDWVMQQPGYRTSQSWPGQLSLIIFDFDGVMTDNRVYVDKSGRESVLCNRADGLGVKQLRALGIELLVASTEKNPVVQQRCAKLQLDCFQGLDDKKQFIKDYLTKHQIDAAQVAYVGNDTNDLGAFSVVGFKIAVADSHPAVLAAADYITSRRGGRGVVQEISNQLALIKQ